MNERPLERCCVCDEPTGHAGVGDGSIYCNCDAGPFCDECYAGHWCVEKENEDEPEREPERSEESEDRFWDLSDELYQRKKEGDL